MTRRTRPRSIGVETLEGRMLTASMAVGALTRPAAQVLRDSGTTGGGPVDSGGAAKVRLSDLPIVIRSDKASHSLMH